jgi:hypothetical protein
MNFRAVMLGRKQYADAQVGTNPENPVILNGGDHWTGEFRRCFLKDRFSGSS